MKTKLYVGNLPYSATDETLGEFFAEAGEVVSAKVISDRQTGRSRGFGFVEMSSSEEAEAAIEQFNGKEMEGRGLKVALANEKPRGGGGGRGGGGRGNY